MKSIFLRSVNIIAALTLLFAHNPLAAKQTNAPIAEKVDEYVDGYYEENISRLDNLAIHLQGAPTAQGYIISYRSLRDHPGISRRFALRARDYLVNTRGVNARQVISLDGGMRGCATTELWIVPEGAKMPAVAQATILVETKDAYKFDDYIYGGYYLTWSEHEDHDARLGGFGKVLQQLPEWRGYIIAYGERQTDLSKGKLVIRNGRRGWLTTYYEERDELGTGLQIARGEKKYLVGKHNITAARVVVRNGGYRRERSVELWLVPPGMPLPKPTPTIYPRAKPKPPVFEYEDASNNGMHPTRISVPFIENLPLGALYAGG